jgi:hypothetical protein
MEGIYTKTEYEYISVPYEGPHPFGNLSITRRIKVKKIKHEKEEESNSISAER